MQVASLRYDVIFKKAFGNVEVFKAFAKDFLGVDLNIDKVETEKKFSPPIGKVDSRFDLYAEDFVVPHPVVHWLMLRQLIRRPAKTTTHRTGYPQGASPKYPFPLFVKIQVITR